MFFRRKGRLRNEFDEKFLDILEIVKSDRQQQKTLLDKSFDPSEEVICQAKLAEAKYFFLLKEAKHRKISIKR
ncbi:YaaL family protein [Bacillus sp. B-jedd]|uniref:YaaL family protein n=1 Tax=Bacillus sp. B-jedd TaxID=1476857 RepID=UPI0005156EBA|nr:YaaL family protein [Bacillus sp. B-jedd]CEG29523.1 cytoplasmic protein [Bacillus sp. B-jedd]